MEASLCPPPRDLALFLSEQLDESSRARAEIHVESCATCQLRLERLVLDVQRDLQRDWPALPGALAPAEFGDSDAASAEIGAFLRGLRSKSSVDGTRASVEGVRAEAQLPQVAGYEILSEIGRGAVGIVYRARHVELNRLVAIKMILAGLYSSPKARQRFRLESQAIARLRHPRIVQVHDVGEQDGRLYLVLELVEGGNLATSIAEGPRPAEKAARIVAELAEAIEHAHAHGVIHRDLKPANVLFHDPERSGFATTTDGECQLKITDFGLAKVTVEDGPDAHSVTQSGEFLGTPSYTAPEQARGDAKLVGPQADVYSLGAILYELLTGRPPFQGASVVETLMQVAHHEVVPAVRLVPGVPRDLDTVCAKCLQKDPARRYGTANDLALDLRRFLAGEPILARPIGRFERAARWIRRRPTEAAGIAGGVALLGVLVGAGVWNAWRDANLERAVHAEFADTSRHAQASNWNAARAALERARVRLDGGGSDALKAQLARSAGDIETAARLESIRLGRAGVQGGLYDVERNRRRADDEYAAAFAGAGLGDVDSDAAGVAVRIAASDIRRAWIAALDDWSACQAGVARADRRRALLELARRAEDDPAGVLAAWRDPDVWNDRAALTALLASSPPANASIELLIAIGDRLRQLRGDAVPLLERVQRDHPDDFWANFGLADALSSRESARAARYYQAALALRPDSAVVANSLGRSLAVAGSPQEALPHLQRAVHLDPTFAMAHSNLGNALAMLKRYDEAVAAGLEAVRLEPDRLEAYTNLGRAYVDAGRVDDALAAYEHAVELDPGSAKAQSGVALMLRQRGRMREAIEHSEKAVELGPDAADVLGNHALMLATVGRSAEALEYYDRALAIEPDEVQTLSNRSAALRALGRLNEALATAERALRLDEKSWEANVSLSTSLAEHGRLDEALAAARRAVELAPTDPRMHKNLGILLQTIGQLDEAAEHYRRGLELTPKTPGLYFLLGLALRARGDWSGSRDAFQAYLEASSPRDPSRAVAQEALTRIDEQVALEERLPGILAGTDHPESPTIALGFAEIARLRDRPVFAAQLAVDAFALEPALAADLKLGASMDAAWSAVLAGSGSGADGAALDASARLRWRTQARDWLRGNLEGLRTLVVAGVEGDRAKVSQNLARWRYTAEFASVRDEPALATMSTDERAAWESFWNDVDALRRRVVPQK